MLHRTYGGEIALYIRCVKSEDFIFTIIFIVSEVNIVGTVGEGILILTVLGNCVG